MNVYICYRNETVCATIGDDRYMARIARCLICIDMFNILIFKATVLFHPTVFPFSKHSYWHCCHPPWVVSL